MRAVLLHSAHASLLLLAALVGLWPAFHPGTYPPLLRRLLGASLCVLGGSWCAWAFVVADVLALAEAGPGVHGWVKVVLEGLKGAATLLFLLAVLHSLHNAGRMLGSW